MTYIREFVRIDDAITNYPKATLKSLSKPVAMAFNRLKQTVKKDMKNDAFAALVEAFRANPIEEEEEPEEVESEESESTPSESEYSSESESESESGSGSESGSESSESGSESEESESESESGSESESESSSESEESDYSESETDSEYSYSSDSFASDSSSSESDMEVNPKLTGRAKWVLQPKDIEKEKRKEEERKKRLEEKKEKRKKEEEKKEETVEVVEATYETPEKLMKSVLQVLANRNRVNERRASILQLRKLVPFARDLGVKYELRVLSHLVSLELAGSNSEVALSRAVWTECAENVKRMVGEAFLSDS